MSTYFPFKESPALAVNNLLYYQLTILQQNVVSNVILYGILHFLSTFSSNSTILLYSKQNSTQQATFSLQKIFLYLIFLQTYAFKFEMCTVMLHSYLETKISLSKHSFTFHTIVENKKLQLLL